MNWSPEEIEILKANGWAKARTAEHVYYKGDQLISRAGNIVQWIGHGRIYSPSLTDFEFWLKNKPKFFKPKSK